MDYSQRMPFMAWIHYDEISMPLEVFANSFSGWMVFAAFIAAIIPTIFIMILGASIIARRYVIDTTVGWSMFVLFFVSVAMLSVSIPKIVYSFKEKANTKLKRLTTSTVRLLSFTSTKWVWMTTMPSR